MTGEVQMLRARPNEVNSLEYLPSQGLAHLKSLLAATSNRREHLSSINTCLRVSPLFLSSSSIHSPTHPLVPSRRSSHHGYPDHPSSAIYLHRPVQIDMASSSSPSSAPATTTSYSGILLPVDYIPGESSGENDGSVPWVTDLPPPPSHVST